MATKELFYNEKRYEEIYKDVEKLRYSEMKSLFKEIDLLENRTNNERELQDLYLERGLERIKFISKYDLDENETIKMLKNIKEVNKENLVENLKNSYTKVNYESFEEKVKEDYIEVFKKNNNIKRMTKEKLNEFTKFYEANYKKELEANALIKKELKEFGLEKNLENYKTIDQERFDYKMCDNLISLCNKENYQDINNGRYNDFCIKYLEHTKDYSKIDELYKDVKIADLKEEFIERLQEKNLDKDFIEKLNERTKIAFQKNFNTNIRNAPETREELLNNIIKGIENGTPKWRDGITKKPFQMSYNYVTKRPYNGLNAFQLSFSDLGQKDPRWMTFNNAKELNLKVKANEKGTKVFAFRLYDTKEKNDLDIEKFNSMSREEQEIKKKDVKVINQTWVLFNGTQIEGMPPLSKAEEKTFEHDLNKIEQKLIEKSLAPISFDGEGKNYYSPLNDSIHLTDPKYFENKEEFVSTMIHEISHSTGHESRLNRDMSGGYGSEKYAREELVAELTTVFAMGELGLRTDPKVFENNAAYLGHWAKAISENPKIINEAFKDASKSCDLIKDKILELGKEKKQEKGLER